MSVKMIYNKHNFNDTRFMFPDLYYFFPDTTFLWGKAYRVDKNTFEIMQQYVSCKDYVVDTYYRPTSGCTRIYWTEDQLFDPCFYLIAKNQDTITHIKERITNFLNPFLISKGLDPVEYHHLHKTMKEHDVFWDNRMSEENISRYLFITFDPKCMINATIMSVFLSIFRYYMSVATPDSTKVDFNLEGTSNEFRYYRDIRYKASKNFVTWIFNNPQKLLVEMPKGYRKSGSSEKHVEYAHGQSGIFSIIGALDQLKYYKTWEYFNQYSVPFTSWFGKNIFEYISGIEVGKHPASGKLVLNLTKLTATKDSCERALQGL